MRKNNPVSKLLRVAAMFGVIIILFVASIIIYQILSTEIDSCYDGIKRYSYNTQTETVLSSKREIEFILNEPLKKTAKEIETEIKETLDLKDLEQKLNSGKIPYELDLVFCKFANQPNHSLMDDSIRSNIFVCTKNGVIYDQNLENATSSDQDRNWEFEIDRQYNTEMATLTIQNLLNKNSTEILVFERDQNENPDHIYYDHLNENIIKKIISTEGLEGLKEYTFLVPVYITENGDIFGKEDIIAGHVQDNNKFIVVQEYNLYDYIVYHHYLDTYDNISEIEHSYTLVHLLLYGFGLSIIFAAIGTIIFAGFMFNSVLDKDDDKKESDIS